MKWVVRAGLVFCILIVGTIVKVEREEGPLARDWQTANRDSVGIAPVPSEHPDPVIQIYGARAWGWRGYLGIHTWISTKRRGADRYQVYELVGWRAYRGVLMVSVSNRPPDGRWFGKAPALFLDLRGPQYEAVIGKIERAVERYPFADFYRVWPGPNSNTFTSFVARQVPELRVDLPPTAIGKDYLPTGVFAEAPSGSGYQFSLAGLIGVMLAREEGLEVNLLGLTFGVDPLDLAVKLPGIGRLGVRPRPGTS